MTPLFAKVANAALVIEQIIERGHPGYFLYTFRQGSFASDTWHQSSEDAKHQADYEWPGVKIAWQAVPDTVKDLQAFGCRISNWDTTRPTCALPYCYMGI